MLERNDDESAQFCEQLNVPASATPTARFLTQRNLCNQGNLPERDLSELMRHILLHETGKFLSIRLNGPHEQRHRLSQQYRSGP